MIYWCLIYISIYDIIIFKKTTKEYSENYTDKASNFVIQARKKVIPTLKLLFSA
jgi:hypothetical protein